MSQSAALSRFLLVLCILAVACGPSAAEKQQAEAAAQKERERAERVAAREAERAGKFAEELKTLSELQIGVMRETIAKTQNDLKGTRGFAAVKDDLEKLASSLENLEAVRTSARESRAAAILVPAMAGFTATDAIVTERDVKAREAISKLRTMLIEGAPDAELNKQSREMTIQTAMLNMTMSPFTFFASTIATLARNGPPDIRRATFDSVAAAVPKAGLGRPRLEQVLRSCYENEDDEPTRSRFASTMASLQVPLTAPPEPAKEAAPAAAAK